MLRTLPSPISFILIQFLANIESNKWLCLSLYEILDPTLIGTFETLFHVFIYLLPPANEVWGKVIFLHLSFCSRGGVPGQVPPRDQVPPRTRYTSRPGTLSWDQVHPQGPGTPPRTRYTPDQVHPPPRDQVHPRSNACWEIRATSGQYASYWNAFLFIFGCWLSN